MCRNCAKKVPTTDITRNFSLKLYLLDSNNGNPLIAKAWASIFDAKIKEATDLEDALEGMKNQKVKLHCNGDLRQEADLTAIKIVLG